MLDYRPLECNAYYSSVYIFYVAFIDNILRICSVNVGHWTVLYVVSV